MTNDEGFELIYPADEFLRAVEPYNLAYRHSTLSFVAVRSAAGYIALKIRIRLKVSQSTFPFTIYRSANVLAGQCRIDTLRKSISEILDDLQAGELTTTDVALGFPGRTGTNFYEVAFLPFHAEGLSAGNRLNVLTLSGTSYRHLLSQPDVDWELKSSDVPFDSLQELMFEYGLGELHPESICAEVIADTVCFVDRSSSISSGKLSIAVNLADGLEPSKLTLGRRVFSSGRVVERCSLSGNEFEWSSQSGYKQGRIEIPIEGPAVAHCFATYGGVAQHQYWVSDPSHLPNPLRSANEVFDPNLKVLSEIIETAGMRGTEARDFEFAVARLLAMQGFLVFSLDASKKFRIDGCPDLVAATPSGRFAIVECTTKILNADKKLANLVSRTSAFRRELGARGHQSQVLAVIVTALRSDEIAAEREQAERNGVLVLARENIEAMLSSSLLPPDPEKTYDQAQGAVAEAITKHQTGAAAAGS